MGPGTGPGPHTTQEMMACLHSGTLTPQGLPGRRLRFSRPPLKDTCGQGQPPCCLSRGCMRNGNISGCFRGIRAAQIGKTARFGHKDLGWVPAHGNHCAQEVGTGATSLSEASALLQVKSPECPRMILRTCCPIKASLPSQTRRGRGPLQR